MSHKFIENGDGKARVYDSIVIDPRKLNIFGSDLALRVVSGLAKTPGCAMDLARSLGEHEQKIYYHLRRLEEAGVIRKIRTEKRYAMTAKIYGLVSPTVTAKLHDGGFEEASDVVEKHAHSFNGLEPFVRNGKLNAKIIIGDSYTHGKYDAASTEAPHLFDFAVFLGSILHSPEFPHYKLDTEVSEADLNNNLILFGSAKTNAVIDRVNSSLPVYFDTEKQFRLVSRKTNKSYDDARAGTVIVTKNPFNPDKSILVIGGSRTRGTQAAVIAFTKHFSEMFSKGAEKEVACVVEGIDKDSDKILDAIRFMER